MPQTKAKLLVLGSKDFSGFKYLKELPKEVHVTAIGTADDILGASISSHCRVSAHIYPINCFFDEYANKILSRK